MCFTSQPKCLNLLSWSSIFTGWKTFVLCLYAEELQHVSSQLNPKSWIQILILIGRTVTKQDVVECGLYCKAHPPLAKTECQMKTEVESSLKHDSLSWYRNYPSFTAKVYTTARHLTVPWTRQTRSRPNYLRSVLILISHQHLYIQMVFSLQVYD